MLTGEPKRSVWKRTPEGPGGDNSSATEAEAETTEPTAKMAADLPKLTISKTISSSTFLQVAVSAIFAQIVEIEPIG